MKYVPLKTYGNWRTGDVLKMIMNQNPRGMMLDEMRRRIAIMDMVDEASTHILLKDEDHKWICEVMNSFPFGIAHKHLLALIDDVLAADEPPAVLMPKKNGKAERAAPQA